MAGSNIILTLYYLLEVSYTELNNFYLGLEVMGSERKVFKDFIF